MIFSLDRSPSRDGQMFKPPGAPETSAASNISASKPQPSPGNNAVNLEARPHTSCRSVSPKAANHVHSPNGHGVKVEKRESVKQSNVGAQGPQNNEFDSSLIAEFDHKVSAFVHVYEGTGFS